MNKSHELEEKLTLLENNNYPFVVREKMKEFCFKEINKIEDVSERTKYMNRYWIIK